MMESDGRQTIKVKPQLYHLLTEMGTVVHASESCWKNKMNLFLDLFSTHTTLGSI